MAIACDATVPLACPILGERIYPRPPAVPVQHSALPPVDRLPKVTVSVADWFPVGRLIPLASDKVVIVVVAHPMASRSMSKVWSRHQGKSQGDGEQSGVS